MSEPAREISMSSLLSRIPGDSRPIRLTMPSSTGLLEIEPWSTFLSRSGASRIFQEMKVFDILDIVFGSYARRGSIPPAWRFDIAEPAVYPKRRFTTQNEESDLAFVERLMCEEGLIYFFEQSGDVPGYLLGPHTMVIAEHNSARQPTALATQTFIRSGIS